MTSCPMHSADVELPLLLLRTWADSRLVLMYLQRLAVLWRSDCGTYADCLKMKNFGGLGAALLCVTCHGPKSNCGPYRHLNLRTGRSLRLGAFPTRRKSGTWA